VYGGEENSTRAHYLEIIGDKVIVISGKEYVILTMIKKKDYSF